MSEEKLFSELELNGKPLSECELVFKGRTDNTRMYVNTDGYTNGFAAFAVEFCSVEGACPDQDHWQSDTLMVDPLFNLSALFDGVRHLEFNREAGDMAGYMYYPDTRDLVAMFQKVRELELKYCDAGQVK